MKSPSEMRSALKRATAPRSASLGATWFAIGVFLCAYVAVLVITQSTTPRSAASGLSPGSSASAARQGSLAVARLWSQLQLPFQAWEKPPNLLPLDTHATFVSIEPSVRQYPPALAAALLAWVRAGHTLVLSSSGSDPILHALHLVTRHHSDTITEIRALTQGTRTSVWRSLALPVAFDLAGSGLQNAQRKYESQSGAVIGAQIAVGHGRVIVWSAPAAFENGFIGRMQNLQVAWHVLGRQPILWDEFGHGVVAGGFVRQMFGGGRMDSLGFLAMAALLYGFASFVRFGRPRTHATDAPRQGTEFLDALAIHLQNPHLRNYLVELLAGVVWRRMSHRLGSQANAATSGLQGSGTLPWDWLDMMVARSEPSPVRVRYQAWRHATERNGPQTRREFQVFMNATRWLLAALGEVRVAAPAAAPGGSDNPGSAP